MHVSDFYSPVSRAAARRSMMLLSLVFVHCAHEHKELRPESELHAPEKARIYIVPRRGSGASRAIRASVR